jgi:formylglycine-generating enzyme required for sulfatase activity
MYSTKQRRFLAGLGIAPPYQAGDLIEDVARAYNGISLEQIKLDMSYIPAGSFVIGSWDQTGSPSNERPQHRVTISRPMAVMRNLVTQEQWWSVMGSDPSKFKGVQRPVDSISWNEASEFCDRLSASSNLKGEFKYRLLTEAEWEYAARAGSRFQEYGEPSNIAWYFDNSGNRTHSVGLKQPNKWGLRDMLGNVWEWTADWYGGYSEERQTDPKGPATGVKRVVRGGGWDTDEDDIRVSLRTGSNPDGHLNDVGLRICRTLVDKDRV